MGVASYFANPRQCWLKRPAFGLTALIATMIGGALSATQAQAHVKWFTTTNGTEPPQPLHVVLTPLFVGILIAFVALVFVGFLMDGWVARRWPGMIASEPVREEMEQRLIRVATGAYLIFVSVHGGVILTPELRSPAGWIPILQFLMAVALIWRPTCIAAGFGFVLLYGFATAHYGVFHLADYPFFPALAFYLGSLSLKGGKASRLREPLLTSALAFGLAWTAIEKFLYPQWTDAVIAKYPSVAFGFPIHFVVIVAGFVEFTLAFYLITGRGLVRIGAIAYGLVFIAAMKPFGKIDVYGHLIIVAILLITALRGSTPLQQYWHPRAKGLVWDAACITLLYVTAVSLFMGGYYALQTTAMA